MMTKDAEAFIKRVQQGLNGMPSELRGYAARAAITELYCNWQAALHDGAKPAELAQDVDQTIELLRQFKAAVMQPAPWPSRSPS